MNNETVKVGLKSYRGIPGRLYAAAQFCENPLCTVSFPQTGLAIKPRRFCSYRCRQHASIIKRVAALFDGLPDAAVIEILRSKPDNL